MSQRELWGCSRKAQISLQPYVISARTMSLVSYYVPNGSKQVQFMLSLWVSKFRCPVVGQRCRMGFCWLMWVLRVTVYMQEYLTCQPGAGRCGTEFAGDSCAFKMKVKLDNSGWHLAPKFRQLYNVQAI